MTNQNTSLETVALPLTDDGYAMHPNDTLFVIDKDKPRHKVIQDVIKELIWLGEPAGWMVKLERCDILMVPSQVAYMLHERPADKAVG